MLLSNTGDSPRIFRKSNWFLISLNQNFNLDKLLVARNSTFFVFFFFARQNYISCLILRWPLCQNILRRVSISGTKSCENQVSSLNELLIRFSMLLLDDYIGFLHTWISYQKNIMNLCCRKVVNKFSTKKYKKTLEIFY